MYIPLCKDIYTHVLRYIYIYTHTHTFHRRRDVPKRQAFAPLLPQLSAGRSCEAFQALTAATLTSETTWTTCHGGGCVGRSLLGEVVSLKVKVTQYPYAPCISMYGIFTKI